jgi:hypothetical protein
MNNRIEQVVPEFVEFMPPALEPGVLYVSIEYRTTAHLCASGCGQKVVLPLHPRQWRLTFDGEHISLSPSIGNASLPCRSHYFIRGNKIVWDRPLTAQQGEVGRRRDRAAVMAFDSERGEPVQPTSSRRPWWRRLLGRL